MASITQFEDIEAWKEARQLTRSVYKASNVVGFAKDFGLRDQIRRAAVSILSNIAEGFERDGDKEFAQFLSLAKGSCAEVRAQLYVALDEGYISTEDFNQLRDLTMRISRMLAGFMIYLRRSNVGGVKFKATPNSSRSQTSDHRPET